MLTPRPYLRTPTTPDTMPAQPAAPHLRPVMRWARSLRHYLRTASLPPSKARPTTCVAIPGSARPGVCQSEICPDRIQRLHAGGATDDGVGRNKEKEEHEKVH